MATSFLVIRYDVKYNFDLTVISIAIIFPLVFTIRAAFRRREKALEHLSRFKSALQTVNNCFQRCKKLSDTQKEVGKAKLLHISDSLMAYVTHQVVDRKALKESLDAVPAFILETREELGSSEAFKIYRFFKDVYTSVENTVAIYTHRTPISLRAYCQIFIYFFPIIYTPALLHRLDDNSPDWIVYTLSTITGFILISLFNVQDQMEHPFDQQGLDDIRLDQFVMPK